MCSRAVLHFTLCWLFMRSVCFFLSHWDKKGKLTLSKQVLKWWFLNRCFTWFCCMKISFEWLGYLITLGILCLFSQLEPPPPHVLLVFHLNFGNNGCFSLTYISIEKGSDSWNWKQFQDEVTLSTSPCLWSQIMVFTGCGKSFFNGKTENKLCFSERNLMFRTGRVHSPYHGLPS